MVPAGVEHCVILRYLVFDSAIQSESNQLCQRHPNKPCSYKITHLRFVYSLVTKEPTQFDIRFYEKFKTRSLRLNRQPRVFVVYRKTKVACVNEQRFHKGKEAERLREWTGELKRMASVTGQRQKWNDFAEVEYQRTMSPVIVIAIVPHPQFSLLSAGASVVVTEKWPTQFQNTSSPAIVSTVLRPIDRLPSAAGNFPFLFPICLLVFSLPLFVPLSSSILYKRQILKKKKKVKEFLTTANNRISRAFAVVHLSNFRPGRDYGRATINSWLGSRSQTNQPANQPAIQPTRQSGGSVYSTWDKGMLGGDTVAAVQANRHGDEGRKEMGVRLEPCCHNTAAN
ncbi:hypothetical protein ANTPLA_LOCUS9954 [Anthophora plagiata]